MPTQKPSIPKGTRDFTPAEMVRRNYLFDTIKSVFRVFGYQPIETPAMENLSTLLGKYGEEGDKLLFRILNSGDFLEKVRKSESQEVSHQSPVTSHPSLVTSHDSTRFSQLISEKGLRYDLTVPLARFVVQHQQELTFPFKRFQIQPVWRADKPQKGRYREFFQCDVDVIGSDSLLYEVELIQIVDGIFSRLNIPVVIKLNNRKILTGIAETIGAADRLTDLTVALDKLEKIGAEKVTQELLSKGFSAQTVSLLQPVLGIKGKIKEKKGFLEDFFQNSETGRKGLEELCFVMKYCKELGIRNKFEFDTRLARGLNYYTGIIIEGLASEVNIGSLCGGGRYDDLTGIFGLPGVSGVGISFGADRIHDVLMELNRFPEAIGTTTRVLFVNFGSEEEKFSMKLLSSIRLAGVPGEMYPEPAKLKKQLDYAHRKQIPYVVLAGKDEMASGQVTVKNMSTGEQTPVSQNNLIDFLL
ncbi:MAG: histidine--tRNA ligase [bacterium]